MKADAPVEYPVRINKYLYLMGICSRREADTYIEKGLVSINNKRAVLGQKVEKGDKVTLAPSVKEKTAEKLYVIFNKPLNVVSHIPEENEIGISDYIADSPYKTKGLSIIGRLDKNSHGLILLSNDSTIVDIVLNPKYEHEKEYLLTVDKKIDGLFVKRMKEGVEIEGYWTKPAEVMRLENNTCTITLKEGKKHQIRRMCAALGYQVRDLKRVRIENIRLGVLREGKFKRIEGLDLLEFLKRINAKKQKL